MKGISWPFRKRKAGSAIGEQEYTMSLNITIRASSLESAKELARLDLCRREVFDECLIQAFDEAGNVIYEA